MWFWQRRCYAYATVSVIGIASQLATDIAAVRTEVEALGGQLRQIETVLAAVTRHPQSVTEMDVRALATSGIQATELLEAKLAAFRAAVAHLS